MNTDSQNQFTDSKGVPINLFTNQFYTNSIPSSCHSLPVGEALVNNGKVQEVYYNYDTHGNLIETRTLFPTRNYAVFTGNFDKTSQTTFDFDLTGLAITDGILVISSSAVPTSETLYETYSESGIGHQNSGIWQGKYFLADYIRCTPELDCYDGTTKIGPFEHYPGSPNYTGYTTWIENNTQYVKTNYTTIVNEYPMHVEYSINTSSWATITSNLGSGTTSITIPGADFIQGSNTLHFRESNSFPTKFEWTLYINQGAVTEENITALTYDMYGNKISLTDGLNNTTLFGYDSHQVYLASLTNAFNQTITATYDFYKGLATSITDARGNTTSFEYDILGRVTKRIQPDLSEVEAIYDDQNCTVTVYNELDHSVIRYYDGLNRLTKTEWYISPSISFTETFTYNYLNRVIIRTDPEGHTYTYEYDSLGRINKTTNPDFTFSQIHYDDATNTTSISDENQHKKEYHYDFVGNLLWVKEYIDPVNFFLTQYAYDDLGNLTSLTDANANTTLYRYDSLFGLTQITYPDSTTETYSYDAVGNLIQKTDSLGTTTFTYNSIYQLVGALYPDSTSVFLEYDNNSNRTLMTDPAGTTLYVYDNRDRCISETRTIEGVSYCVNYIYDSTSQVVAIEYPNQAVVTYEYDPLNRLINIPGYAQFNYNADSLLTQMTYGNGIASTYQYNSLHRPISLLAQRNETDLLSMNYQYDPVGNVLQMGFNRMLPDQQWAQSTETFQYDWLDRLTSVQGDYESLSYSYDPLGNRLSKNDITYTYNTKNELLSTNDDLSYTYDGNGNTITRTKETDTWSYTYDTRNLLTKVEKNQQVIAQYDYDGDGQRIKKTEWVESLQDYQTLIYICSQTGVIYEKNVATGQEATYVYGPTGRIAKNVSGLIDYYHTDCLGSTRLITNESGNTVTDVTYTPFGEITLNGEEDHYLYTGKEKDSTDLYYFGARYYDPQIGRFITRDPLKGKTEYPQTLNLYAYCLNNPLKYIDPHGMDCVFVILPDGTISYELADIMNMLQDALGKLDWDDVQSDLDDGDLVAALKTILETVFPDSEIIAGEDIITVKLNGGYVLGFIWSDSSDERLNLHRWGFTEQLGPFGANIYLNKDLIKDAGDLFCVLSHELTHAYLHREFTSIDLSEMSGGDKRGFQEAVAYTIEWRIMSQINDDYLTENFKSHVNKEYAWAFLYYKLGPSYDK